MPDMTITADVLSPNPGPAYSATSDAPDIAPAAEPAPEPPPSNDLADEPSLDAPPPDPANPITEADGDGPPAEPEPADAKPSRINRRFSELATEVKVRDAKLEAANDYIARLEALVRDGQKQPEPPQTTAPEPPPAVEPLPPRPQRDSFDTPEAYDAAMDAWHEAKTARQIEIKLAEEKRHIETEAAAAREAEAQRQREDHIKQQQDAYNERRAKVAAEFEDFAEVVDRDDLPISEPMAVAIMQNEDGPRVAYHLGKHPEIAQRIAAMVIPNQFYPQGHPFAGQPIPDVPRQLLEMGRLFATFGTNTDMSPPPVARVEVPTAPPPITPVRRSTGPAVNRSLEELGNEGSMEDYAARRMPQLQAERTGGHRAN